jgi:hypothetical protein
LCIALSVLKHSIQTTAQSRLWICCGRILYEGEFDPQSDVEFPEDFRRALVRVPSFSAADKPSKRGRKSDSRKAPKYIEADDDEEFDPADMGMPIPNNYDVLARWKHDGCFRKETI